MSVGDGLFFSSLLLSVVLLYIFTRDRWKWKKIVLRSVAAVTGFGLFFGVGLYAWSEYRDRPQRTDSMWGVTIGESRSDVKFAKGEPSLTEEKESPSTPRWIYKLDNVIYGVYFKDDKVTRVIAFGNDTYLPSVSGVSVYASSIDHVTAKLGAPSYTSRSRDGLRRIYSFPKFNVAVGLERGAVYLVAVGVTEEWPVQLADEVAP